MQVVTQTSAVWWSGGIGSTDVAAFMGCGVKDTDNPLTKWADKVWQQERPLRKQAELEQGTPEWHEDRRKGLGGSEVAVVVGASYDYGNKTSPWKTWEEKTKKEPRDGESENVNMKRGKSLEPEARFLYESIYDWSVPPLCVIDDHHDCLRCSLDGIRSDDKLIVEIKACGAYNHQKLLNVQAVEDPLDRHRAFAKAFDYYRAQVQYQLMITGAGVCHFVGYNKEFDGPAKLAVIELYPEPRAIDELRTRALEFWRFVENREPPDVEWCIYKWSPPTEIRVEATG